MTIPSRESRLVSSPSPRSNCSGTTTTSFRRSSRTANTGDVRSMNVTIGGQADLAVGWNVSGDYFRGLAVAAAAGRLIVPDDDRAGAPPVAVVSHGFGQRRFGDAANAVGQAIRDQRPAVHGGGRDAAGILRRRSRGGAGHLPSDARQSSCWALVSSLAFDPRTGSPGTTTGSKSWADCVPA